MMFHSDQPIDKKELDCLNRSEFSRQLAKAIISYTKKYVIHRAVFIYIIIRKNNS